MQYNSEMRWWEDTTNIKGKNIDICYVESRSADVGDLIDKYTDLDIELVAAETYLCALTYVTDLIGRSLDDLYLAKIAVYDSYILYLYRSPSLGMRRVVSVLYNDGKIIDCYHN